MQAEMRWLFALLTAAACVSGPTFVVQQFNGAQKPNYEVAILRVNGNDSVRLLFLDDQDVAAPIIEEGRLHVEMLTGRHTVVVGNVKSNQRSPQLAFNAEAGRVYRVAYVAENPKIFEVNRSSDSTIREVTEP